MTDEVKKIRLRKIEENEIIGPMDINELKVLAETAYISPGDEVSFEGEIWIKAVSIEDLGMFWMIRPQDGLEYGPTTKGTIREFLAAGEIEKSAVVVNIRDKKECTVEELLGKEIMEKVEEERKGPVSENLSKDLEESMEMAKEIRIRTLEVDYDSLRKEFDELSQKYRRATEELTALKKA